MAGVIDILAAAGGQTGDQSAVLVDMMVRSSEFGKVLQSVEDRARFAVIDETKKNALTLMTFAVAGGAIGGMVFKGYYGTVIAAGLAAWAAWRLVGQPDDAPPAPQK